MLKYMKYSSAKSYIIRIYCAYIFFTKVRCIRQNIFDIHLTIYIPRPSKYIFVPKSRIYIFTYIFYFQGDRAAGCLCRGVKVEISKNKMLEWLTSLSYLKINELTN